MVSFKGAHFAHDILLTCVRWYVAYPLSYCQLEELMQERGGSVDHATIHRWVLKYSPPLGEALHRRKRLGWLSWRMNETYIKGREPWKSFYCAVDKADQTIDFLLTDRRDERAATRFLTEAIHRMVCRRRLLLMGVRPMPSPSEDTMRCTARRSSSAKSNISTIRWK